MALLILFLRIGRIKEVLPVASVHCRLDVRGCEVSRKVGYGLGEG